MKTIGKIFKLFFIILVLLLIFHNFTARLILTTALRFSLGVPVEVGAAHVDLLNTQVTFDNVLIKNPADFPDGFLAQIPRLYVDFETASIWEGRFDFEAVEVELRELRVVRIPGSRINLLGLRVFEPYANNKEAYPSAQGENQKRLYIKRLNLKIGRTTYTDLSGKTPVQKSFNLDANETYNDVREVGDIVEIVTNDVVKGLGLDRVLDDAIERFGLWRPAPKSFLKKAVDAVIK